MKTGYVYHWPNFQKGNFRNPEEKPRWLICLGNSGPLSEDPKVFHFCTTTTRLDDFQPGGNREKHPYWKFDPNDGIFTEECIVDFKEPIIPIYENNLSQSAQEIDRLPDLILTSIYEGFKNFGAPKFILRCMVERFRIDCGLSSLTNP